MNMTAIGLFGGLTVLVAPGLPVGAKGTLVVAVPVARGIIVAADTRQTTLGVTCDGSSKVATPAQPANTIIAATGTATWISARVPLWPHDPCGDLAKNGITFFDALKIATDYLQRRNEPIWLSNLKGLADTLMSAVLEVNSTEPAYVRSFAGRTMFQIVLAAYSPTDEISHVRALQFNLTQQLQIKVVLTDRKFSPRSTPDCLYFGDTENYDRQVLNGPGKQFLPVRYVDLQAKKQVSEVTNNLAEDVAVGMIEAAKKTSKVVEGFRSIGGPVEAYQIGPAGAVRLR